MKIITCFTAALLLWAGVRAQPVPRLSSYPSAGATIYLDFDGETVQHLLWNNGQVLDCAAPGFTAQQITEIFHRVAEDFRPFEINITTEFDRFLAAPADRRIRVIITPTSFFAGVGGVSYTGSFTWGDDTPCFVFSNKLGPNHPKMVAECCSHEAGHTLGLAHQARYDGSCALTTAYNDGSGTGETSWAPIMGNSYYRNMSGWNNGPTPQGCSNLQDNLSVISTRNGIGFRADDYTDEPGEQAFPLVGSNLLLEGIIGRPGDRDVFRLTLTRNSNLRLDATPFSVGDRLEGAGLDIRLLLFNSRQELIGDFNPAEALSARIDTVLPAGIYYVEVSGTGNSNTSAYSSLGAYTLSGLFNVLPVCQAELSGSVQGQLRQFSWTVNCNETLSEVMLQASADGQYFTDLQALDITPRRFSLPASASDGPYFRLKLTSVSGHQAYSGTVRLAVAAPAVNFVVSTLVTNDIRVQYPAGYQYVLTDLNGRPISAGKAGAGLSHIPLQRQPAGIYILLLDACGIRQTVRVLKM